jgi:predicted transcriptional regulator
VTLRRAWHDAQQSVGALSDRLRHDPFLGHAVHGLLTHAAAIRSSAEILESVPDIEPARRTRFAAIVGAESRRLADSAQALAAFFDQAHSATRSATAAEEVDDFIVEQENHFPELEDAADAVRRTVGEPCHEGALADWLLRAHGVRVEARPADDPALARSPAVLDATLRTIAIRDTAVPATRRFELARSAAQLHAGDGVPDAVLARATLSTDAARRRARRMLSSYLAAAVVLPYAPFLDAARMLRYDLERLAQRFGVSFEQVCQRATSLRRPGAAGIPFALMRVDAAGYVNKRLPLPGLPLPRHGNACPMWAVYEAWHAPGSLVRQLAAFPTGERFLFVARTVEKPRAGFGLPRRLLSLMLACDALHADQTVYADGLDLASRAPAVPVGPHCRACVRRDCRYREEDPIIDA